MALWHRKPKRDEPAAATRAGAAVSRLPVSPRPAQHGRRRPLYRPAASFAATRYGLVYVGPVFAAHDDVDGPLCPWCIADGTAAERFEAEFTDVGVDVPDGVNDERA